MSDTTRHQPDRSDIERVQRLVGPNYRLDWIVGRGGMSTVWLAHRTGGGPGDTVAVKVLKPEYTDNAEFRERFRNEAVASAKLDSPNVVRTYDYREVRDAGMTFCFIIMEFVQGESLADVLAREKQLSEQLTVDILTQATVGLQAIHAAGMVHRDIKPGNLLITPDGTVKVADFGIAKAAEAVPLTRTGMVVGTAQYVSPEQAQGRKVGAPSDIYSLGVVGFEMLTGHRPFRGDSTVSVAIAHINEPVPDLPNTISPQVRELIAVSLRKDPRTRYANGAELFDAIQAVRAGHHPPTPALVARGHVAPPPMPMGPITEHLPTQSIAAVTQPRDVGAPSVQGPATRGGSPVPGSLGGRASHQRPGQAGQTGQGGQAGGVGNGNHPQNGYPNGAYPNGGAHPQAPDGPARQRAAQRAAHRGQQPPASRANPAQQWPSRNRSSAARRGLIALVVLCLIIIAAIAAWWVMGVNRSNERDRTGQLISVTTVTDQRKPSEESPTDEPEDPQSDADGAQRNRGHGRDRTERSRTTVRTTTTVTHTPPRPRPAPGGAPESGGGATKPDNHGGDGGNTGGGAGAGTGSGSDSGSDSGAGDAGASSGGNGDGSDAGGDNGGGTQGGGAAGGVTTTTKQSSVRTSKTSDSSGARPSALAG